MDKFSVSRKLFDQTIEFIGKSLDARTLNHRVLSGNIANAETPDYQAKDIRFQEVLEKSLDPSLKMGLKRTHFRHLPEDLDEDPGVESTNEAVDLDREMAKLAENNVMFHAGIQALAKKFDALRFTITDIGR